MTGPRWIVPLVVPARAGARLLCVPYAGGGVSVFARWPDGLPRDIELWVVQLPGRERRIKESPVASLETAVNAVAAEIDALPPLPLVLFGHSMGGLLSFELARHRQRRGAPIEALVVSGVRAPHRLTAEPALHTLPDAAFIAEVQAKYDGIPAALLEEPSYMQLFLPILRADIQLLETYRYLPQPPLDCAVYAFGGDRDAFVKMPELEAWAVETRATCHVRIFPGGHFFVNTARQQVHDELSRVITAVA